MSEENPFKISKPWFYIIISLAIISLATVVGLVIYLTYNKNLTKKVIINEQTPTNTISNIVTSTENNEPTSGEDAFGKYITDKYGKKDYTEILNGEEIKVEWYKGAKKASDEEMEKMVFSKLPFLKAIYNDSESDCISEGKLHACSIYLFKSGIIKSPQILAGKEIFLALEYQCGMGCGFNTNYAIYDDKIESLINLKTDGSDSYDSLNQHYGGFIVSDITSDGSIKDYPRVLSVPETNGSLIFYKGALGEKNIDSFYATGPYDNDGGILNVFNGTMSPTNYPNNLVFTDSTYGPVYFVDGTFRYIMPDGSIKLYDLLPYFFQITNDQLNSIKNIFDAVSSVDINWYNKHKNTDEFELGGDMGKKCGPYIAPYTNIVNNNDWFDRNKLVAIGETKTGEKIYELSDKITNSYYKEIFEMGYDAAKLYPTINGETNQANYDEWYAKLETMTDEEKYADFINDKPLFFWKDHMGNWRVYKKAKYRSLAECGKPVIYLYPEQEMNINVQVKPNAGFSKTEPAYPTNGWLVKSSVNSDIYNYADNTTYPYLFWEGNAYNFITPDYGFVMSKKDVSVKMNEILSKLGLNQKEINDFMEFWQPKLEVKPYVFVTFLPQREFDKIAPLTVDPKPDTIIRIMMDYIPLDAPIKAKEPHIKTPERIGFTVVEWGGRLH